MALLTLALAGTAWALPAAQGFNFGRHKGAAAPQTLNSGGQTGGQPASATQSAGQNPMPKADLHQAAGAQSSSGTNQPGDRIENSFSVEKDWGASPAQGLPNAANTSSGSTAAPITPATTDAPATTAAPATTSAPATKAAPATTSAPTTAAAASSTGAVPRLPSKVSKLFRRKDFSGKFSYVLPEGWGTYQIPFQVHDCLSLRDQGKILATFSFNDEIGKTDLKKLQHDTIENDKKQLEKYELAESKMTTLANGQDCAIIVSQVKVDDVEARQVHYIVELKKKHFLVATLTATKPVGEKYDKLMQDVMASITTDPNPDKPGK